MSLVSDDETVPSHDSMPAVLKCWETFFRCQRSPVLRSQMLTVLMAGTPLEAERVPVSSLLDAVLIAFAARMYCQAEIVDDFKMLCERTEEEWRHPEWNLHGRLLDSLHANAANFIINHGINSFSCGEEQYIPSMVRWYLDHECPTYFDEELDKVPPRMLRKKAA